jgi:hypothetical protein
MPVALDMFMNQVEQITGKQIPKEFRQGIKANPQDFTQMLTQSYLNNPQMGKEEFAASINPQAMLGMMMAFGGKKKAEEAAASQRAQFSAATGPAGAAPPQNTTALTAKRDRIEQALADPNMADAQRKSLEKILEATNSQLGTSVDDKSKGLAIAREFNLDPGNPQHQQLISQELVRRDAAAAGATEFAKNNAAPLPANVAQDTGLNPLLTRGEARSMPGASGVQLPSQAQIAGQVEGAKENAKPIDLGLARDTGMSPLQSRGEARQNFGAAGVQLPTQTQQAAAGEDVKITAEGYKQYAQAARDAASRQPVRQQIRALLPFASTGMGAQQRMQLDRLASTVGVKSQGLAPLQVMDMLSNHLALANRKDLPGSMSNADREFLVNSEVNINKDKNAIGIKLAMDDLIDQRIADRAAAIPKYNRTCGLDGSKCGGKTFDEVWGDFTAKNSLQPKFEQVMKANGYNVAPAKSNTPAPAPAPSPTPSSAASVPPPSKAAPTANAVPPMFTEEQIRAIEGDDLESRVRKQFRNSFRFTK